MSYASTTHMTFVRRRAAFLAFVAALVAAAAVAASTSASQTQIRAHVARDGSTVVTGYDGGVALAPGATP